MQITDDLFDFDVKDAEILTPINENMSINNYAILCKYDELQMIDFCQNAFKNLLVDNRTFKFSKERELYLFYQLLPRGKTIVYKCDGLVYVVNRCYLGVYTITLSDCIRTVKMTYTVSQMLSIYNKIKPFVSQFSIDFLCS